MRKMTYSYFEDIFGNVLQFRRHIKISILAWKIKQKGPVAGLLAAEN